MSDRIILCIGTKKGLFVAESSKIRRGFTLRGPFGQGVGVYSALLDTRATPRLYASSWSGGARLMFGVERIESRSHEGRPRSLVKPLRGKPRHTTAQLSVGQCRALRGSGRASLRAFLESRTDPESSNVNAW